MKATPKWRRVWNFLLAAPPRDHAETQAERRQRWFENGMAITLAVAAVLATWASFEAAQWGGKSSSLISEAGRLRADSNRFASRGAEQTVVDASVWLEWEKAVYLDRDELRKFIRDRFSPALDEAQDIWLGRATGEDPSTLPKGTPLTLDEYVPPGQAESEKLAAKSEDLLAESRKYGSVSSRYVMTTVILALVLFFGSIATRFPNPKIQLFLCSTTLVLLLVVAIRTLTLPVL